jgi:hypothetical protein
MSEIIIADTETQEVMSYFYVVHGTIPELMPSLAYRRLDKDVLYERKAINCPNPKCPEKLTYTSHDTRVELYKHPIHVTVNCQFYMRCKLCDLEIGINIAA